jgi:hypothetical protein
MENIICNGSPTDYKVELRTWNWQSRWADAKVKISETIKVQSKSSKAA